MKRKVGWEFPLTNGGRADGYNDPGIAHFNGAPLSSLARETIQNSLDAPGPSHEPVHISFELIHLPPEELGGDELKAAIEACREASDNTATGGALEAAQKTLQQSRVTCLRVSDRNTTGLQGNKWRTLVKMQGASHKPDTEGAGGSHGIGKYAPFAVSTLRTVFYWTCYQENGRKRESFQGKSVLMSHHNDHGEETQGTGFYGIKKQCQELIGSKIPARFRVLGKDGKSPLPGTSLSITGFRAAEDWRKRIASSVIENYFYAVDQGKLTVLVGPDEHQIKPELLEIDKDSLQNWFEYLEENPIETDDSGEEVGNALKDTRAFWEISRGAPTAERQDKDLGHCKLWIRVEENLPSKVALVRRTGMLITNQQSRLLQFRGYQDFAALCVFEDPKGNEFLRNMENPQHNQFEPERLPDDDKQRGRRALNRITKWVRTEIHKAAGPPEGGKSIRLEELAPYLPDLQPDDRFDDANNDDESSREPGFGHRVKVTLKQVRRSPHAGLTPDDEPTDADGGDGDDTGNAGGSGEGNTSGEGGSGGRGDGEGVGGTGGRGGDLVKRKAIPVSGVRLLPIRGQDNCYRLSFRADEDGVARLEIQEAGDSSTVPRDDIRVVDDRESFECVHLHKGTRTEIIVTADMPIGDRALRLRAVRAEGD